MIYHMVLVRVRDDVTDEMIREVFDALAALKEDIPGLLSFEGGRYTSPEGLNKGFEWGFCMTFDSAESRDTYLPHPAHQAVGSRMFALLDGGEDGIICFDFAA